MTFRPYDLGGHFKKTLIFKIAGKQCAFLKIVPNWITGVVFMLIDIRCVGEMTFGPYDLGGHFESTLILKIAGKLHAFLKIAPNWLTGVVFYADQY